MGQELRKGTQVVVCLYSVKPESQLEDSSLEGWKYLNAHSLSCLVVDAWLSAGTLAGAVVGTHHTDCPLGSWFLCSLAVPFAQ